jgi:tetratricopeptide (TPR) repeat protein
MPTTTADARGLALTTTSAAAAAAFDHAVRGYVNFRADTPYWVQRMGEADPDFAMGHCLKGYLALGAFDETKRVAAAAALEKARAAVDALTRRERLHIAALEAWQRGRIDAALARWGEILATHPTDLLALRLADTNWFWLGRSEEVLRTSLAAAAGWRPDLPGYDGFLAIWAFAHEEKGHYEAAERAARRALELDPENYFAAHALAHVLEMTGRRDDALRWFAEHERHWGEANNMLHHLWWHRMLFHLGEGDHAAVLACYDAHIRNLDTALTRALPDLYIDMQNAAALLWRLELLGVAVGGRWSELAEKAERRVGDATNLLSLPHFMLALAADGRFAAAERFMEALAEIAREGAIATAADIAAVAIPVCRAALAHRRREHAQVVALLAPIRGEIRRLGGSKAQRDLFTLMLLDSAIRTGDRALARSILAEEGAARPVPLAARAYYREAAREAA